MSTNERIRGRKLQERRARLLAKNPLCVECEKQGKVKPATELDHIIPMHQGGPDTEANLQPLCRECHDIKSATERGCISVSS